MKIENFGITFSKSEKLLRSKFNNKLNLDDHISNLCKRTSRRTDAILRVTSYINTSKKRILMRAFFELLIYYSLLWISHSCGNNIKIKRLHKRCLQAIPTKSHRSKHFWKKMVLFLFIIEIFRFLQLKCISKE